MWTTRAEVDDSCLSAGMGLVKIQRILCVHVCCRVFFFYNIFELKKVCSTNTRWPGSL